MGPNAHRGGSVPACSLTGQFCDEALQAFDVPGVERVRAQRVQVVRGPLEASGVACDENQLAAGRTHLPRGLQTDTRAASHHHDRLSGETSTCSTGFSTGFSIGPSHRGAPRSVS
jgi:hypothetical protein